MRIFLEYFLLLNEIEYRILLINLLNVGCVYKGFTKPF